jgi:hypothetical protein
MSEFDRMKRLDAQLKTHGLSRASWQKKTKNKKERK